MPDLIVIDGGKGQLNAALRAFEDAEVTPPVIVGLAKARDEFGGQPQYNSSPTKAGQFERIFLPGRSNPILLKPGSDAWGFFTRIRDETHNLAVGFHRKFRRSDALKGLERIAGMGPQRRKKLMDSYVNLEQLRFETAASIAEQAGLPMTVAENVVRYMQQVETDVTGSPDLEADA